MMQVNLNQQVVIRSGGSSRPYPARVSPAESNLVKPLEVKIWGDYYGRQAVDGKGGNTTIPLDIPAFFGWQSAGHNQISKNIHLRPGGARGGTADWSMISNSVNSRSSPSSPLPPHLLLAKRAGRIILWAMTFGRTH